MVTAISSVVSLLFLFILYSVLFRRLALDTYREALFQLRNDLFDLALTADDLGFDSKAYRYFEAMINRTIQYAHNADMTGVIVFSALNRVRLGKVRLKSELHESLVASIDSMSSGPTRDSVISLRSKYDSLMIRYILRTSPLVLAISIIGVMYLLIISVCNISALKHSFKDQFRRTIGDEIEYQAESFAST